MLSYPVHCLVTPQMAVGYKWFQILKMGLNSTLKCRPQKIHNP